MVTRALGVFFLVSAAACAAPTYSKEVSRIVRDKCQACHRPNDIAPFALTTYDDARTWAEDIARVVSEGVMPPWKPVPGHGEFRDFRGLTPEERQTILDWAAAGAPEGDPADLPEPTAPAGEWLLGEPGLTLTMPEPFTPTRGRDVYRCFVLPVSSDSDLWVDAIDILPGNRRVVHHVILYIDRNGESPRLDARDDGPGYTCFGGPGFNVGIGDMLGGWAPGTRPYRLPEGVGSRLPAGSRVVMQVHYYTATTTGPDITRAALYFSAVRPERQLYFLPAFNDRFEIPAGAESHTVRANFPVPPLFDAHLIAIFPHMHLLGKEIRVDLERLGRPSQPLIYINRWDFNWQGGYAYQEPVALPSFSNIRLTCTFDNSEKNPRNPANPIKPVRWGEGTEDEMCLAFLAVTFDNGVVPPLNMGESQ